MRIPPSVLKKHNKSDDAWSSFNGKVYNITPYLKFHPGGEKELMRVAGRDGTKLFGMPTFFRDRVTAHFIFCFVLQSSHSCLGECGLYA